MVRVDIIFAGEYYIASPTVTFTPQRPYVKVTPNEIHPDDKFSRNRLDPTQVGYYSKQGKVGMCNRLL